MKILFLLLIPSLLFGQVEYVKTLYRAEIDSVEYHGRLVGDSYERNLVLTYSFSDTLMIETVYDVDPSNAWKLRISYYVDGQKRTKNIFGKMPGVRRRKSKKDK